MRDEDTWEEWILFMLTALETTAKQTIATIESIKSLMAEYKVKIKKEESNIYSHELINTIFAHPYTKIDFVIENVDVSRITASKYLKKLVALGLLKLDKYKNTNYYANTRLVKLFNGLE